MHTQKITQPTQAVYNFLSSLSRAAFEPADGLRIQFTPGGNRKQLNSRVYAETTRNVAKLLLSKINLGLTENGLLRPLDKVFSAKMVFSSSGCLMMLSKTNNQKINLQ